MTPSSTPHQSNTAADSGRRERKRRQTLDLLVTTAFHLFDEHGYEAVTMAQIAARADVAKGTLYNHFPVKEALLAYRFHGELAQSVAGLQSAIQTLPTFALRLAALFHASAKWSQAHRSYLPHYLRFRLATADYGESQGQAHGTHSGLEQVFESLIRAGQSSGEFRADISSWQLAHMLQFLYLGTMMRWLAQPKANLRHEFDAMLKVFLRGLEADSRPGEKT